MQDEGRHRRLVMNLRAPESVQKLQAALHAKAKEMPDFRFYALYDKVYREDVLFHAWRLAKANGGSAGVDGQTFSDIEDYGVERWLGELAEDLRSATTGAARLYPETRRAETTVGDIHNPRQGGRDGGCSRACADLRG